jgi:uncharacterized protein
MFNFSRTAVQLQARKAGIPPSAERDGPLPGFLVAGFEAWAARGVSREDTREDGSGGGGRSPARHLVVAAATVLWLSGLAPVPAAGAGTGGGSAPVRSLLEMRRENVIVQDFDLSCGAAALATLLTYQHGDPVSEQEVARGLIQREEYIARPELVRLRQGFSLLDLKRYVERRGYAGIGYGQLELADLIERAPIMVPVNFNGYNHFVIFRGLVGDRALLADPAYGNRTMPVEAFEDALLDYPEFGKVGFVVARRDGVAPPNRLAPEPGAVPQVPDGVLRRVLSVTIP